MSLLPMQPNMRDRLSGLSGGMGMPGGMGMDMRNPLPNRPMPSMPTPMPNRIGPTSQPGPGFFQKLGGRLSSPDFLKAMGQRFGPKPQPNMGIPQPNPELNPGPFEMTMPQRRFSNARNRVPMSMGPQSAQNMGPQPMMRRAQMDFGGY